MNASSMRGSITRIPLQPMPWAPRAFSICFWRAFDLIDKDVQHGTVGLHFQDARHAGHQVTGGDELVAA